MALTGYVDCAGFNAVMDFIAVTSGADVGELWLKLAQAAAKEHGFNTPRPSKKMDCEWLLKKLQATTPEAQWDLVSRVEPLFHSAWEESKIASDMIKCASLLYPPRNKSLFIVNDEVRLATCDIVATVLQYNMDPRLVAAFDVARKYALREVGVDQLRDARNVIIRNYAARDAQAVATAVGYLAEQNDSYFFEWGGQEASARTAARVFAYRSGYETSSDPWVAVFLDAEARNAKIVRKSLGTPGLALLMR